MGVFQMWERKDKDDGPCIRFDLQFQKKVLVVGGGGREHALVQALSRSSHVGAIWCAPGNPGMAEQARCIDIPADDIEALLAFAKEAHIDLTVVGPEVPLSAGIADRFAAEGLRLFGPSAAAARIESSKDFAKRLMTKYGIPTAAYRTFDIYGEALDYVRAGTFPVVLKYDGLAAGKGVVIAQDEKEAETALREMLVEDRFGKGKVVVEEFLTGQEFSFMCLVCGRSVFPLALAQDHKRAFEGDEGPNTGGMGAYSPVPFLTPEDETAALERIMKPAAAALAEEGCPFKGLLYGGLIKTAAGIKVIEFNCRFGDPETEVVLPRLQTDIYELFSAIVDGQDTAGHGDGPATQTAGGQAVPSVPEAAAPVTEGLHGRPEELMPPLRWKKEAAIGFVLASKGYPGPYQKGFPLRGLADAAAEEGIVLCHMGTRTDGQGGIVTAGGRVLMVTASAPSLVEAKAKALKAIAAIDCDNLFYRRDIGRFATE